MGSSDQEPKVSKLPLLIMGAVIALVVLVTIGIVAGRGVKTFEPGSPEAALQDYLEAGLDEDEDRLLALLDHDVRATCEADLDRQRYGGWSTDDLRAELDEMAIDGDSARAEVTFRNGNSGDPFGGSGWSYQERFDLVLRDGTWFITSADWPYPIANCTRGDF